MPTYDYRCEANGRVVEVNHRMSEAISTWGELCQKAGIDQGETAADSPVKGKSCRYRVLVRVPEGGCQRTISANPRKPLPPAWILAPT